MNPYIKFLDPSGKLLLERDLERFPLKIGRVAENDIVLSHPSISRFHCRIEDRNGKIWIVDQDSVNGIRIQNKKKSELELSGSVDFKLGEIRALYRGALDASLVSESTQVVSTFTGEVSSASSLPSGDSPTAPRTSIPSLKPISAPSPIGPVPSSEEATVVRKPAPQSPSKPSSSFPALPSLKKPGTGFEESTATRFQIRSDSKPNEVDRSVRSGDASLNKEEDTGITSGYLERLRTFVLSYSQSSWVEHWKMGAWIAAGFIFAYLASWIGQDRKGFSSPVANQGFWSRSERPAETMDALFERVRLQSLDSRSSRYEP